MRKNFLLILIFLFTLAAHLFASARQEENEIVTQKDEWVLCITKIDTNAISGSMAQNEQIGNLISAHILRTLNNVAYRTRISPEYAYYEELAQASRRSEAARALSVKQNERSALIYRGDPQWKYLRDLAAIDSEIEKLRANLEELENRPPVINSEPVFKLAAANLDNSFPAAPASGSEYRFCSNQKIDAFLALAISEFHGRYLLDLNLYTVYTGSYSWQDMVLFSHNDIDDAVGEISQRLLAALTGNRPASVVIRAEPENALILINNSFAGRGASAAGEYPPGTIKVDAASPDYERLTFETDVTYGEQLDISLRLKPVNYGFLEITSDTQGSVYHGSLYMGETPLTLRLPLGSMEYIELETPQVNNTIIFQMPSVSDSSQLLFFDPVGPPESGRVETDRSWYYWTLGGTWISGIAAWIIYNAYVNSSYAIRYDYNTTGSYNLNYYRENNTLYYVSMGTVITFGVVAAYGVYRLVRYLITADKSASPTIRTGRN